MDIITALRFRAVFVSIFVVCKHVFYFFCLTLVGAGTPHRRNSIQERKIIRSGGYASALCFDCTACYGLGRAILYRGFVYKAPNSEAALISLCLYQPAGSPSWAHTLHASTPRPQKEQGLTSNRFASEHQ